MRLSPGFREHGDTEPSFELKYLVEPAVAANVVDWARGRLEADPFGDPEKGGAYVVHTLYLDTAALDVFRRSPSFRRRKFRLRRYGKEGTIHLEQKTRAGDRVAKRRTAVDEGLLDVVASGTGAAGAEWGWFQHRVFTRMLGPAVRVSYLRSAFIATEAEGPLRLTLDEKIEAEREPRWSLEAVTSGASVVAGRRVLELKYRRALPTLFKDLIVKFGLSPATFSKYRTAVSELGFDRPAGGAS